MLYHIDSFICHSFVDGIVTKPPPTRMELSDEPDGWKYWLDHVRGY